MSVPEPDDPLRSLLRKLVPDDAWIEARTIDGSVLRLNTVLPARRQVLVARAMERLLRRTIVVDTLALGTTDGAGSIVGQVVAVLNDDESLAQLGTAFCAAYPDALPAGVDPLDVLAIEEVVLAVLPLLVRPLLRGLDVVGPLGAEAIRT